MEGQCEVESVLSFGLCSLDSLKSSNSLLASLSVLSARFLVVGFKPTDSLLLIYDSKE